MAPKRPETIAGMVIAKCVRNRQLKALFFLGHSVEGRCHMAVLTHTLMLLLSIIYHIKLLTILLNKQETHQEMR